MGDVVDCVPVARLAVMRRPFRLHSGHRLRSDECRQRAERPLRQIPPAALGQGRTPRVVPAVDRIAVEVDQRFRAEILSKRHGNLSKSVIRGTLTRSSWKGQVVAGAGREGVGWPDAGCTRPKSAYTGSGRQLRRLLRSTIVPMQALSALRTGTG